MTKTVARVKYPQIKNLELADLRNQISLTVLFILIVAAVSLPLSSAKAAGTDEWVYTVRPGDSVWSITERYLLTRKHAPKLLKHNGLDAQGTLVAGSRIRVPLDWLRTSTQPATIKSVSGTGVLTKSRNSQSFPLAEGALLRPQDKIVTGDNTTVVIEFADKSVMTVRSNSEVVMDSLSVYGNAGFVDTRVRLQRGRSSNKFVPNPDTPAKYEVHTPAGISAVRGTNYRVSSEGDITRTETLEGKVAVSGTNVEIGLNTGFGAIVGQGFGTKKEAGKPPLPPVVLLPAPETGSIPEITTLAKIEWQTVAGANAYRVTLADNEKFTPILKETVVAANNVVISEFPDASYFIKLNAIDGNGIEGFEAAKSFELNARPFAPSLASLAQDGGVVRGKTANLSWKAPADAAEVFVQIASSEDFSQPVLEKIFDKQVSNHAEDLPDGKYFWRVASLDATGKPGPYSDAQSFVLAHEPSAPKVGGRLEGKTAIFSWPADPRAAEYEVRVYRERDFSKPVAEAVISENKYRMENLKFGHYDARVVAIADDGYRGAPSALAKVIVAAEGWWANIAKGLLGGN